MPRSRKSKKPKEQSSAPLTRKANTREERNVQEELPLMIFSFKDFQYNQQIPPGQSYEDWQKKELLAYMLEKFGHICNVNRVEAEKQKFIKVYGSFPSGSAFKNPFPEAEVAWAVVMKIKGQKSRVAGYVEGHIFYVVFLDEDHVFFPTTKR